MKNHSPVQSLRGDLRKGFGLFCFLIAIWGIGSAQNLQLGVQGGLAVTNFRYLTSSGWNSAAWDPAISGGVNLHVGLDLGEKFTLFVEPGLIQKSARPGSGPRGQTQLLFLQLPVLLNFPLGKGFSISAGPGLGTPLRAIARQDGQTTELRDIPLFQVNRLELSGVLGVSYALGDAWDLGLRYNHSITPAIRTQFPGSIVNPFLPPGFLNLVIKTYTQYAQLFVRWKW